MGKINTSRVILGGLLMGLIVNFGEYLLNDPILGTEWEAAMRSLNRSPLDSSAITTFVVLAFALGIVTIWTYAAIRPRLGAGPKTAVCAGLLAWFFACFYPGVSLYAIGIFAPKLILLPIVWGLVEFPIAAVAGAWLYKEA